MYNILNKNDFFVPKSSRLSNVLGFTASNCSDLGSKNLIKGSNLFLQFIFLSMGSICIIL